MYLRHFDGVKLFFPALKMVLKYHDRKISPLEDVQNLTAKELREILRSHSESTAGIKADLVLKVNAGC